MSTKVGPRSSFFFFLQVAAQTGSVEAQMALAQGLEGSPEAVEWLQAAARQGHGEAMLQLAGMGQEPERLGEGDA